MYWGIAALILFIGAFGFLLYRQHVDIQQLKKEAAEAEELEKHMTQQPAADNKPPRPAKTGFEWEWHGDHWHEMPVAQNDAPQQTPASEKIVFTPARKLNFPDEIPEKFPTEDELRQMDGEELSHLAKLYTKASNELRKTDRDAGVRLYNATIPILYKIQDEQHHKSQAIIDALEKEMRAERPLPWSSPATEESPAVYIDTKPPKKASSEGGKQ